MARKPTRKVSDKVTQIVDTSEIDRRIKEMFADANVPVMMTIPKFSELFSVGQSTVHRLINEGAIEATARGGRTYILHDAAKTWMKRTLIESDDIFLKRNPHFGRNATRFIGEDDRDDLVFEMCEEWRRQVTIGQAPADEFRALAERLSKQETKPH